MRRRSFFCGQSPLFDIGKDVIAIFVRISNIDIAIVPHLMSHSAINIFFYLEAIYKKRF
jgi:hypothetical protein